MDNFDFKKYLTEGRLYEEDNKSILRTLIQDLEPFEYEVYAFDSGVDPEDGAKMEEYIASLSDGEISSEISKLRGITEEGKSLNEDESLLKFKNVERGRTYTVTTNFGKFKKGEQVTADTVRNLGTEVVLILINEEGEVDSIKGDLEAEVEVLN